MDIITKRQNSLFGHVVRLDDHTAAHRTLSQVAAVRTAVPASTPAGADAQEAYPRYSWIQQIGDGSHGTPFDIRAE